MPTDSTRKRTQLVLLDRDGVINYDSADYIKSPNEWQPIPGALSAIARLNGAGIDTALCSNQAGISRGKLSARDLAAIHRRFSLELAAVNGRISLWRYCPHSPEINCTCRKPNDAMLTDCMSELGALPNTVTFIGDSLKDMQAAQRAGCQPLLVRTLVEGRSMAQQTQLEAEATSMGVSEIVDNLKSAVDRILKQNAEES